ncbi:MAG TPA: archaeosine biosynthesis radical SAM protein RaSEA [Candidatus Thermoplasmatota archaeon]|nr:archaeosine biosynthesis radical SAM protein RaSEA [Candidatus Thermoplasmatota archaeon]
MTPEFTKVAFYQPLAKASREARRLTVRDDDPTEPSTTFTQPDRWEGKEVQAFVVILRTRGCRWALGGGCTFCGYVNDSFVRKIEAKELITQFTKALASYKGEPILKIYTSGSFFDPYEVAEEAQSAIVALVPGSVRKLNVEAQAPDVTESRVAAVAKAKRVDLKLEVGVGLESANPAVARYSVNKEFFLADFEAAAKAAAAHGATLKAYTMVKPPYLTEAEAIEDAVATARLAGPHASTVSFNPMNIQKNTLVERLWTRGQYRPPWLWSVVEVLKRAKEATSTPVKSDPVAGGKHRGAHNCGTCDDHVLAAIQAFNVSQDVRVFSSLACACQETWRDVLDLEGFHQGPIGELADDA